MTSLESFVRELARRAAAVDATARAQFVRAQLRATEGVSEIDAHVRFRFEEWEIAISTGGRSLSEVLEALARLDIVAAPRFIVGHELSAGVRLELLRYTAAPGERVVSVARDSTPFTARASAWA